jgi:hypothetical protein
MSKPTLAQLLNEAQRRSETSQPLSCPHCGAVLPEGWRTDDVTSETKENDPDNDGDAAKALKVKYADRQLSVVDRILLNRGIDPFEED